MAAVIIADIGGTTSRFALVDNGRLGRIVKLAGEDFDSPEKLIGEALSRLSSPKNPGAAVLALAAAMTGGDVILTNRRWHFRRRALAERFGWDPVVFVNDFEATAHALPDLTEADVRTLAEGPASMDAPKLVLGPGTGLGAAVYLPGEPPRVQATEAGHISFGPAHTDEERIFARLRERLGFVSAETILSGPGLARLHDALAGGIADLTAAQIAAGLGEGDAQCRATMRLFARLIGRFAGDLALAFRAAGGVYLAGGVLQRLHSFVEPDVLMGAFLDHPPHGDWLRQIPVHIILAEEPGLIGCAAIARSLDV